MATEYLPGSNLSRGKLYSPRALLTTLMVTVEPARFALTSTPSMAPSACDVTLPASAEGDEFCAVAGPPDMKAARAAVIRRDERGRIGLAIGNPLGEPAFASCCQIKPFAAAGKVEVSLTPKDRLRNLAQSRP
jgi:hypothetical protein